MSVLIKSDIGNTEHFYKCGDCHIFAIALNRLTGAPMVSVVRKTPKPEAEWDGDEERDKFNFEHAHAAVLIGDDILVDVDGAHRFHPEDNDCMWMTVTSETSAPYLEMVGDDWTYLDSSYAMVTEDLVAQAMKDAADFGCVGIVSRLLEAEIKRQNFRVLAQMSAPS